MNKASKSGGATKPAQKRSAPKQPSTKLAKPSNAQGGGRLAEVVAQLAQSAEKLAQAANRLTEATTRLSLAAKAQPESVPTQGQPAADAAAPQQESSTTVLQRHNPLILRQIPRREAKANPDAGKSKTHENRPFMDNTLQSGRIL
jgi:hypothetical protein